MPLKKIDFVVDCIEPDFLRVYYSNAKSIDPDEIYCLQPGPSDIPELLSCTPSGEPSCPLHPDTIGNVELPPSGHEFAEKMALWLIHNRRALNASSGKRADESHQGAATALDRLLYNCCPGCRAPDWSVFKEIDIYPTRQEANTRKIERRIVTCDIEDADYFTVSGRRHDNDVEAITDCAALADAEAISALFSAHFID